MSSYWQGKGAGKKIAVRFNKPLLGDVTGNETAFTIKGMVRNPLKYGPLMEKTFTVESVERYPLERYWQDDFGGEADGVELGPNGLRLERGAITDDFNDPLISQGIWTIAKHGGNGTQSYTGGECVLTPEGNKINSVSMRAGGSYTSVKVKAKLGTLVQGKDTRYFDITLGSGAIVDVDNGAQVSWWHTALAYGYSLRLQEEGHSIYGIILTRRDGAGTQQVELERVAAPTDWHTKYHEYEIQIHSGGVRFLIDSAVIGNYNDTTYNGGDILIAQGSHTSAGGAVAYIDHVYAETGAYAEEGTYTATLPTADLHDPRFRCEASIPDDTAIIIEYACTDGSEPDSEDWAEIEDGDLLTITDDTLWLRYTLTTDDPAVTPTLLSAWLEEATAPPGTILLTMTPDSRFNDAEGDITVSYEQAKGTLTGTRPVGDFTESFTPTGLEPTPIDRHDITAGIEVAVDFIEIDYRYFKDDSADHIITAGITVEVDLIPVSEIPP